MKDGAVTFKARLGKPEPVWQDELTPEGKKIKIRYLKLTYYCTIADFPEALQYDGADMWISKLNPTDRDKITITKAEYEALTGGHLIAVPSRFVDALKTIRTVVDDAIAEAEQVKNED